VAVRDMIIHSTHNELEKYKLYYENSITTVLLEGFHKPLLCFR